MLIVAVPYATDAPIYHWPYATVGLIAVNTVVGLLIWPVLWFAEGDDPRLILLGLFVLQYGFFNPVAWITSNYLHADPIHLVGNMVLLWAFGIIVEGKIGWWRFLLLYNAIGFFQCGLEQVLTMGFDEGARCASAMSMASWPLRRLGSDERDAMRLDLLDLLPDPRPQF
jgi:membrane associated rhomboid family serine protease